MLRLKRFAVAIVAGFEPAGALDLKLNREINSNKHRNKVDGKYGGKLFIIYLLVGMVVVDIVESQLFAAVD